MRRLASTQRGHARDRPAGGASPVMRSQRNGCDSASVPDADRPASNTLRARAQWRGASAHAVRAAGARGRQPTELSVDGVHERRGGGFFAIVPSQQQTRYIGFPIHACGIPRRDLTPEYPPMRPFAGGFRVPLKRPSAESSLSSEKELCMRITQRFARADWPCPRRRRPRLVTRGVLGRRRPGFSQRRGREHCPGDWKSQRHRLGRKPRPGHA